MSSLYFFTVASPLYLSDGLSVCLYAVFRWLEWCRFLLFLFLPVSQLSLLLSISLYIEPFRHSACFVRLSD